MNPIFASRVERRDFGVLLTTEGLQRIHIAEMSGLDELLATQPPSQEQAVWATWSQDPRRTGLLPELLVCDDGTESDWAAWISTFAPRIRPFSAYSRLLGHSEARTVLSAWRSPDLGGLTWPVVGVVLGEVLTTSRVPDRALDVLPAVVCSSTISFAMFRAAAIYSFYDGAALVDRWRFAREVAGQRGRLDPSAVARVCRTIVEAGQLGSAGAFPRDEAIGPSLDVCREFIESPDAMPRSLARVPALVELDNMIRGPREDRVVALERFFREVLSVQPENIDREVVSMLLGYLTSRVAPGTMRHSAMLRSLVDRYPTALLWYGFCAGLSGRAGPSSESAPTPDFPPIGRRVARELLRPEQLLGPPSSDISVLEVLALSRGRRDSLNAVLGTTHGTTTIELLPGVVTAVSPVTARQSEEPYLGSAAIAGRGDASARMIDRELGALGDRIAKLRRDLNVQQGDRTTAGAYRRPSETTDRRPPETPAPQSTGPRPPSTESRPPEGQRELFGPKRRKH